MPPQSSEHGFYHPTQRAEPIYHPKESEYLSFLSGTSLYEKISLFLDVWRLVLDIHLANIHTWTPCHSVAKDLETLNTAR